MKLKIVSFDVDGTLVDQKFNQIIWEKEIPQLVSRKEKWSFEKAREFCVKEYEKVGDRNLHWYDIKYWLDRFGIKKKAIDILKKWENAIEVYPDVIPVLKELKRRGYKLIIITGMPRIFLGEKTHKFNSYFDRIFSTISDFKRVKSPEIYLLISKKIGEEPSSFLHIGDHPALDFEFSRQAGYRSLLIERDGKNHSNSIESLEEIFNFL